MNQFLDKSKAESIICVERLKAIEVDEKYAAQLLLRGEI